MPSAHVFPKPRKDGALTVDACLHDGADRSELKAYVVHGMRKRAASRQACTSDGIRPFRTNRLVTPDWLAATKTELQRQITNISSCMKREAQTPSLKRVDFETAAHAVVARCANPAMRAFYRSEEHTSELQSPM